MIIKVRYKYDYNRGTLSVSMIIRPSSYNLYLCV